MPNAARDCPSCACLNCDNNKGSNLDFEPNICPVSHQNECPGESNEQCPGYKKCPAIKEEK
jgi:hypothetical protein